VKTAIKTKPTGYAADLWQYNFGKRIHNMEHYLNVREAAVATGYAHGTLRQCMCGALYDEGSIDSCKLPKDFVWFGIDMVLNWYVFNNEQLTYKIVARENALINRHKISCLRLKPEEPWRCQLA
jgi:hypothetical protein